MKIFWCYARPLLIVAILGIFQTLSLLLPCRLVLGPALEALALVRVAGRHARRHGPLHSLVARPLLRCRLINDGVVLRQTGSRAQLLAGDAPACTPPGPAQARRCTRTSGWQKPRRLVAAPKSFAHFSFLWPFRTAFDPWSAMVHSPFQKPPERVSRKRQFCHQPQFYMPH
jgi:hypothetical protein